MIQIIIGYIMDLIFGDPYNLFHPVRWIGTSITKLEQFLLNKKETPFMQKLSGVTLLVIISGVSFLVPFIMLKLASLLHPILVVILSSWMIYQTFATKCLDVETKKVYKALKENNLKEARHYIGYLVSRDTDEMSEEDILKAAIETIAENLADGVVAPIFYVMIGGAPLGWFYKSVNTLDSMVGYRNEKYLHFGWASARFDDVLNYIPARLTAIFIALAGVILKLDVKHGLKMLKRDRHNHSSPNSAYPESITAGLLGIQLGGKATYFGETSLKPTMGDALKNIEVSDLKSTANILYVTSLVGFLLMLGVRWLI